MGLVFFKTTFLLGIALVAGHLEPATGRVKLENRIQGWISAVNQSNYRLCSEYVAPPEFTSGQVLKKFRSIRGADESLYFSGAELLPLSEYRISNVEFNQTKNFAKVSINAKVIYYGKSEYLESNKNAQNDLIAFPATIIQSWIYLRGEWFITSQLRIQYLGDSDAHDASRF